MFCGGSEMWEVAFPEVNLLDKIHVWVEELGGSGKAGYPYNKIGKIRPSFALSLL